jgi:hypothetical protein
MIRGGATRAELPLDGFRPTGVAIHDQQTVRNPRGGGQRREMKGPGDGSTPHHRDPKGGRAGA